MAIKPNNCNFHQAIFLILAAVMLSLCTASLTGCGCESPKEQIKTAPEYIECGTCGAHVSNWWKIRNDANTEWVNVCVLCAQELEG